MIREFVGQDQFLGHAVCRAPARGDSSAAQAIMRALLAAMATPHGSPGLAKLRAVLRDESLTAHVTADLEQWPPLDDDAGLWARCWTARPLLSEPLAAAGSLKAAHDNRAPPRSGTRPVVSESVRPTQSIACARWQGVRIRGAPYPTDGPAAMITTEQAKWARGGELRCQSKKGHGRP